MNEEILKLKKRKQKLLEAIEFTKQKKKQVFEIVQKLASKVSSKLITRHQYEEELKKALKNRTAGQWIKYYDDYLDYYNYQVKLCDKLIKEEKYGRIKETARKKAVPALKISIIIVFIALMFSLVFILRPVGMNVFSKIGEKVSATINQLTEKAQPAPEEVLEVPAVAPSEFIEPTVPIVLENEQASIEEESLIQYPAILGKPVKWKKQFTVSSITGFSVELPRGSENIGVNAIEDGERRDITNIADINKKEVFFIFGERAVEVNINTNSITGNAISGSNSEEEQEFEIIYETPAPAAEEEIIENGKRIIITGPDDVHYKNILSFTELTKELTKQELDKFELYQIKDNQRIKTQFTAYDTNENGLYDDIEWITPELSEAEFLLIIEISKAEHLDENRENGVDIYESVKELDGNWSETINENEYVRVTFEQKLDNTRDITIYARAVNYLNNSGECYDDETEILTREEVDCDEVNCNDENVYCEEIISYNEIENKEKDANNVASKAMQILTDYNNSNNNRYLNVSDNKKNKGVNLTPTVKNYSLDNNNYEAINYINFSVDNNLAEEAELILTVRNRSEKSGLFPRHPGSTPGLGASALSKKCYKEEWKYFYELTGKEEVMTLNSETGEKEWQIPVEKQAYDNGNNDMYKIVLEDENGEESELLVSEKHKVYAGENYLDNNKLLSPIKVNPTNFPDSDCLAIIPEPKSKLSAFSGFPNEMYNTSAFSSYSNDILSDFSINSSILFSCLSIYLNKKQLAQNPQFEMILYMQLLDAYCLSQESCQTSLLQEENLHLLAEQDLACLEPLLSRSLCLASQDEPCKYVSSVPLSTLLEHCLLKMQHASFGYYNFDGYKKLSMADFSLQKITDVYKDINENNKEIYFLDSENKPIKVKSITKQAYNGKIYDVDVKNDIVLVRRNNVVCETEEQTKEITNLNLNTEDYINNKDANNINKLNDNNKIEEVSEKKSKSSLDNNELVNNKLINNENKCRVIEGKAVWSGNSNPVSIEVYEKDGNDLIAKFENIIEGENKVYLTNLENEQDVFDLKVVDGSLEIDYIVDPIISEQQAVTDSILINVTAETNFTHLNISSTAPFDSLVGYWNFDGDQENGVIFSDNSTANRFTVYDFSKNNRDGFSVIRPYVNSTNCIYGDCVKFDGNSSAGWRSYINLSNKWSFIGNQSLTIMMWAYPYGSQASSGDARMIQSGSDCLLRYVNNRAEFILNLFNDPNDRVNSPANTFPVNTWTHLVGMYNNATNNLSLWVNGVVVNSTAPTGNFGTCSLWTLGGSKAVSGGYNGSIDEVMVFNDALTAAQILAIYNNQSARFATQGTQDIVNQSYMNISTGNNRVNVTTYIENLLGSSINLSVGYYDGSWSYTTPQVVSSGVVQIFNITDTSTNLTLNYTFIAGSFTAPFYSPILKSNITFEAWNEGEGVADITPPDINFTFPTPPEGSPQIENSIYINVTANDSQNNISAFIDFDRSLIGWWRMDEYNLTGIFDNSSYNNFGVFTGGLSSADVVDGHLGKGLEFDGIDDYLNTSKQIITSSPFTISLWIKSAETQDSLSVPISQGHSSADGVVLQFYSWDAPYLCAGVFSSLPNNNNPYCIENYSNTDTNWKHVVLVANDSGTCKVYVDGRGSRVRYTYGGGYLIWVDSWDCSFVPANYKLVMGMDYKNINRYFNGSIDDVMIFNRSLSANEIAAIYANQTFRYLGVNFTNLAGGVHKFRAYAQDTFGNLNWTEERIVNTQSLPVGSCSVLNVANTVYTQTADIFQQLTEDCIIIVAQNITYNCNGYSITSLQSSVSGVYSNQYNTTIKNCNVTMGSSGYGINLRGANYSYVFNSTLNNQGYGLYLDKTSNTIIEKVTASLNIGAGGIIGTGVFLSSSSNNNLKNITASSNGYGIFLSSSSNNILTNINASSNTVIAGISLSSSSNNTLTNIVTNNNPSGVYTTNSKNNILTNITANSNDYQGISLSSSSNNILTNINANLNTGTGAGVYLSSSSNNNLKNITASSNGYGISLSSSSNNTLTNINASLNGYMAGIYFTSGSSNSTLTNIITNNNPTGIYITTNSERNILINITANSNTEKGVYIAGVDTNNNILTNITANSNLQYGIHLSTSSNNTLMDNNIWNCTSSTYDCLYLENSDGNTILGGIINKSSSSLIRIGTGSENNVFKDIKLYNSTKDAINVSNSPNNTFDNLLIYSPDTAKAGIYSNSLNTTIKNSNITMSSSAGGYGISFYGANSSYVFNNNLSGQYDGLYLYFTFNTKIENNSANNNSYGIRIQSSQNNILINNIVDNINNGIRIQSSQNNILINNIANNNINGIRFTPNSNNNTLINNTANNNSLEGFLIDSSSNNILISNTVNNNTKNGIYLWLSSNNNILINNIVNNNADNGILFNVSSNNTIRDSNVLFNLKNDTFLASNLTSNSTNNIFINVTYNASKEYVEAGSQLIRKWYYQAYVNDTAGNAVANANVTAYNRTNSYQFNLTTGAGGLTPIVEIVDYINYGGTRSYYSDYTTYADNETLFASHKLNVTAESLKNNFGGLVFEVFTLVEIDTTPPDINFTFPTPSNGTSTYNTSIEINVSIVEEDLNEVKFNWEEVNATIYDNSTVLFMNFDNRSSLGENDTRIADLSGNGNNGTVINATVNTADCRYGNCFSFDGNGDYVNVGDIDAFDNEITISAWIKPAGLQSSYVKIISKRNSADSSYVYSLQYDDSQRLNFNLNDSNVSISTTQIFSSPQWYHIVATYNGSKAKIYINNKVDGIKDGITTIPGSIYNTIIGAYKGNSVGNYFNGTIDEIRIWNRSLSVGEIKQLYFTNLQKFNQTQWYLYVNQSDLREGTYQYQASAKDKAGNENQTEVREVTINIDNTNPDINFTAPTPSNASFQSGNSIFVNVTANDSENNISTFVDFDNSLALWMRFDDKLIRNGDAETNTTDNWNGSTYGPFDNVSSEDCYSGNYCFYEEGAKSIWSEDFIPINTNESYYLEGRFKAVGTGNEKLYFGYVPYDENKVQIQSHHVNIIADTETVLCTNINAGDKSILIKNATNWEIFLGTNVSYDYVAFNTATDFSDLPNRDLSNRNITNKTKYANCPVDTGACPSSGECWNITFDTSVGKSYPLGTSIREHKSGSSYMYSAASDRTVPMEWIKYSRTTEGESLYGLGSTKWWHGTKYARILLLMNWGSGSNTENKTKVDDISLKGGTIADFERENYGFVYGDASLSEGYFGKGFSFDGVDDYVDFNTLNSQGNKTLSFWFRTLDTEQNNKVLVYYVSDINDYLICGLISNAISCSSQTSSKQTPAISSQWHHIAVIKNSSSILSIYLDGVKSLVSGTTFNDFGNDFLLGKQGTQTSYNFNGTIDDIIIFNRTLSNEEIIALYANTSSRYLGVDFMNLAGGSHKFKAYAQDTAGNINETEERIVNTQSLSVSSCGVLNVANAVYTQTADIFQQLTEDCIIIAAENITYNCNGYSITSSQNVTGIYSNQTNTTIKNCNVSVGYKGNGIYLQGANYSYVFNSTLNNQGYGLYLDKTSNTIIEKVTASLNIGAGGIIGTGVFLSSSSNNNLKNITASSNGYGIFLSSSSNNILTNINASSNTVIAGISLSSSSNNTLTNIVTNNNPSGVYTTNSKNNILTNINANLNTGTGAGVYLSSSSNNNLKNITASSNGYGISLSSSSNNTLTNINASLNGYMAGIYFTSGSSNSTLTNIITNNNPTGIYITTNSERNILINITANSNTEKGVYIAGVGTNNNILTNITANSNLQYGIHLSTSSNNTLMDNNIWNCTSSTYDCLYLENSDGNTILGGIINKSNSSLIRIGTGSENNVFKDIKLYNSTSDAVNVTNSPNSTFDNLFIYSPETAKAGIYSNSLNTTIKNSNITMSSSAGGYGISFYGANSSYVFNNNLSGQYIGLYLLNTYHTQIKNITANSNKVDGITLFSSSNNTLTNITANSNDGSGIYFSSSSNNILTSITSLNDGNGIYFSSSSNNILTNINASSNTYYGVFLLSSSNNTLTNNIINLNNIGIYVTSASSNNKFINTKSINSIENDTFLSITSINNTFLNVTYNASKEYVEAGSQLIRKWYYQAYVNDTNGNNVGNANVSFYNKSNFLVGRFKTNSSGWINRTEIIDYVNLGGVRNFYSPYTITAVNKSSVGYRRDYNVTLLQNKLNNFITIDVVNPNINFTWPTSSGKIYNKLIFVNVSANDFSSNISTFIDFDNSLVGWWRMDDLNSSGGVIDYTGKNNGTAVGNAMQTDAGKMGKGFYIPGSDNCIKTSFNGTEYYELTISAWVKTDVLDSMRYIVDNSPPGGGYSKGYGLRMNGDNLEFFAKSINGSGLVSKEDILTVGQWYHVVAVHNTTDNYLYVNAEYPNKTSYNSSTGINASNSLMSIGSAEVSCTYGWDGIIDDVMIFNRSLSVEEIRALYANTSSRYLGVNFPNLAYKNYTFRAYAQDEAGNVNLTEKINVSIINVPPVVIYVQYNKSITPNSGGIVNVSINFTVYDRNDYTNLNDSSARANFSLIGYEQSRVNLSCSRINSESLGNYANYSCTIGMWYYDKGGAWNISVSIEDLDGNGVVNNSNNFSYEILYSWDMVPNYVNWSNIEIGQATNKLADNNMTIRNLGNVNIINASVNATRLIGVVDTTTFIPADNFSFSNSSSDACLGAKLKENQNVSVNLFINYSKSINYSYANSTLGFCLKGLPAGIPAQEYETETNKPWNIDIVFGFFISVKYALLVVAVAVRKKKKLKKILTSENLLEIFDERLKEKYNIGVEELLKIKEEKIEKEKPEEVFKEEIQIPLVIFKQQISPAEALCKYLKENLGLKFREIAKLLNRNERTVWINYRNAVKKKKEKIKIEEYKEKIEETKKFEKRKEIYLPVKIFANRKLSILENIVSYLKEKEMRNKEIAKMLGKDQRNVYTLCSRAKKKLK